MSHRLATVWLVLFVTAPASADIVFSQVPNQSGGFPSDMDYYFFGQPNHRQRIADDFQLSEAVVLTTVQYWGFYYDAYYGPPSESVRLRFYGARASDDLPDESAILYEQTVQNPTRQETGEIILAGNGPPEYRYTIDLASPVSVAANTTYWLEVVQLDDPDSDFAWESAHSTSPQDRIAGNNAVHPDWDYVTGRRGQAFQLMTPEPSTIGLWALSLFYPRRRGMRGACARSCP